MKTENKPKTKMFLDIPNAAQMAGFSIRNFLRIVKEDRIPIVQIGKKFFILGRDFEAWEQSKQSPKFPADGTKKRKWGKR